MRQSRLHKYMIGRGSKRCKLRFNSPARTDDNESRVQTPDPSTSTETLQSNDQFSSATRSTSPSPSSYSNSSNSTCSTCYQTNRLTDPSWFPDLGELAYRMRGLTQTTMWRYVTRSSGKQRSAGCNLYFINIAEHKLIHR